MNTLVISWYLLISVSESKSNVFRVTQPLTSFSELGLSLLILTTHFGVNNLLKCRVDVRDKAWFKFSAAERAAVHISLCDFLVTLEACEMLARRHYWLNTEF